MAVFSVQAEEVCYTLEPATGSNNSYAGNCDITIDGITWNLTGNSTILPWRIGGKSLTGVDRALYSKTPISSAVSKVVLTTGTASSITVNSAKLLVAANADFSGAVEYSFTFAANSDIEIPISAATGSYYKFVFNVTVSGSSNKFIQITSAKFYAGGEGGDTPTFTPADGATFEESLDVTINAEEGLTVYYSTDNKVSYTEGNTVNITETTTVYAYAEDAEGNQSDIVSATYTKVESVTIAEAKAAYDAADANTDVYINLAGCVVTVNSGKYLYIQDSESGINIYSSGATYPAGTKFTAGTLNGTSTVYNGMHQISSASFSDDVTTEAETVAVTPIDVTVAQLNSDYATYEGRYVKLSGVALAGTTITQGNDTYS